MNKTTGKGMIGTLKAKSPVAEKAAGVFCMEKTIPRRAGATARRKANQRENTNETAVSCNPGIVGPFRIVDQDQAERIQADQKRMEYRAASRSIPWRFRL